MPSYSKYNSSAYYSSYEYSQYRPMSYGTFDRSKYNSNSVLSSYCNNYKINQDYSASTVYYNSYKYRSIYN